MKDYEVIDSLLARLATPVGRHLYAVLGTYRTLEGFAGKLQQAKMPDGQPFPPPSSANSGILDAIPDDEFHQLAADEARHPEPTAAHVAKAFEKFLRTKLASGGVLVLAGLEMLFAYRVDLGLLRTLTTDQNRLILLLPGTRMGDRIGLFPDLDQGSYLLPKNLVADNHIWELER